jgi:hypothetical protein
MAPHTRCHGHPADAPLPKLKRKNVKIPRYTTDKFWLENHPECNRPSGIEDSDEEVQDDNELDSECGNSPEQRDDEN